SVSFAPGDATYAAAEEGDTVVLETGEKYAKKTLTLDFSAVTYEKPGIYRYKLNEVDTTNDGVTNDEVLVRYCDVYVNQKAGSVAQDLEITGYAIHKSADEIPALNVTDWNEHEDGLKDNGYQNLYETYNLTIEKQITGNHGWKNNYFEFTLKIDGVLPGSRYDLVLDDATSDKNILDTDCVKSRVEGDKTVYYLEADANGDLEYTFFLSNKGGNAESIQVLGLTAATKYFIEEDCQDYDPSWKISEVRYDEDGNAVLTDKGSGTLTDCLDKDYAMGEVDNMVVFTNNREVSIVTGLNTDRLPIVIGIAVVAIVLIVFVLVQRKKAKDAHKED
ncbi:MAG: FctA domain-containing protein, partial [Acutalibacteraceae bacterium]|nr:FctA domain-containing protein [Acutalibacteraceae bacterium]